MPTPEQNKEAMEALKQLEKDVAATPPSDRGPVPNIRELKGGSSPGSMFRQEEVTSVEGGEAKTSPGVTVESGVGQDGLEGESLKSLLRELIRVTRAVPQELNDLLRQD